MPPTPDQKRKAPWWVFPLIAIAVIPGLFLLIIRADRARRRADDWIGQACAKRGVIILDTEDFPPQAVKPSPRAMKLRLEQLLGRRIPWYFNRHDLAQLWNRRFEGVLWKRPKVRFYSDALRPQHDPPQGPFDAQENGGRFIYLTNRSEKFLTYLIHPELKLDYGSLPFSMGYTNLWICEHVRTFRPPSDDKPTMLPTTSHPHQPGFGPWVVLSDPQFWTTSDRSGSIVRLRTSDKAAAETGAQEFARTYGIAACVARIDQDYYWH